MKANDLAGALGVFYYENFTGLARLFRCLEGRWQLCAVD
jgi:hypothetical protein